MLTNSTQAACLKGWVLSSVLGIILIKLPLIIGFELAFEHCSSWHVHDVLCHDDKGDQTRWWEGGAVFTAGYYWSRPTALVRSWQLRFLVKPIWVEVGAVVLHSHRLEPKGPCQEPHCGQESRPAPWWSTLYEWWSSDWSVVGCVAGIHLKFDMSICCNPF